MFMLTTIPLNSPGLMLGVLCGKFTPQNSGQSRYRTQTPGGVPFMSLLSLPADCGTPSGLLPTPPPSKNFQIQNMFCGVLWSVLYSLRLCSVCSVAPTYAPPARSPRVHVSTHVHTYIYDGTARIVPEAQNTQNSQNKGMVT